MNGDPELPESDHTIRRILDHDRTILGLAGQLGRLVPGVHGSDLTLRQLVVLHALSVHPQHIGEVAEALGITISSASGLIDRMVRAGLVRRVHRDPDRRLVSCVLTGPGRAALHDFIAIGRLRLELVLGELSARELETVEHALGILVRGARTAIARSQPQTHASTAPTGA